MAVDESLETARLRGARVHVGDFAAYFALFRDPRVTATLTVDGQPLAEEVARERFAAKLANWERDGFGLWFFRERDTGRFVGYCGLQPSGHGDTATVELLYAALPEHWGRGLTSEMAAAVLRVGFAQLGLDEVVSYALPTNVASHRVMEKQGFRYERDIVHAGLPHRFFRVTRNEWRRTGGVPSAECRGGTDPSLRSG
jgi:RimJ/RimL family protein N-acetyltransferase